MDNPDNLPTAYEDIGPTRRSTYTEQRSQPRSAKTARLISELGLRYRPSVQADLEAHAATLALLTRDLAEVDPAALEAAINKWVRESPFMPKVADLLTLIQQAKQSRGAPDLQAIADRGNALCTRPDLQWVVRNGDLKLEPR